MSNYYKATTNADGRLPELVQPVGLNARDDASNYTFELLDGLETKIDKHCSILP